MNSVFRKVLARFRGRRTAAEIVGRSVFARLLYWAAETPEAVALTNGVRQTTYKQLVRRSSRVAEYITQAGLLPRSPVAILVPDTLKALQVAVGILGAGHPIVFLESRQRLDRLQQLCVSSGAQLILTEPRMAGLATEIAPAIRNVCAADLLGNGSMPCAESLPGASALERDPFSITCTSGSSGAPKAFVRNQRAVLEGAANYQCATGLGPGDRLLIGSPPTFGLGLHGTFSALCCGASALPIDFSRLDGGDLAGLLTALRPSLLLAAPSILRLLAAVGNEAGFNSLRGITAAGESLRWEDVVHLSKLLPEGAFIENAYGISDCGGIVSRGKVCPPSEPCVGVPSVGMACPGFSLRVVDESGELADGETGMIEVTADCLPVLLGGNCPPERLVTADLGCRLADGSLQLVGRVDDRVKVHGFLVSVNDVETVLSGHPAVADVAVGKVGDELTVWLVARAGYAVDAREIREYLKGNLASPVLLTPRCILLPELPRLPGGKVDRQRLVSLAALPVEADAISWNPQDELGKWICSAWQAALSHSPSGANADFFVCGGDSLSAIHACGLLGTQLKRKVSPTLLLKYPTPALLAEALRREEAQDQTPPLFDVLRSHNSGKETVLIFPGGLVAEETFSSIMAILAPLGLDAEVVGFRPEGLLQHEENISSWDSMVGLMDNVLRAQFPAVKRWLVIGGCVTSGLAFEVSRRLRLAGHELKFITLDGVPPAFFQTRPLRPWHIDNAGSSWGRRYFEMLLTADLTPWPIEMDLLISSEFAEESPDPDMGWRAFSSGPIRAHVFAGEHLTYLRLRRPAIVDCIRRILT
jgi:acyl-coenzyme A synthetase/AMP-(fatty) acid ligase